MPAFHGRAEELASLRAELVAAHNAIPRLVLVDGEPGAGKSALLERFALEAREARLRRLRLYHLSPDEGEVYEPLLHAARAITSFPLYRRYAGPRQARRGNRGLLAEWLGAIPIWGDVVGAVAETAAAISRRRSPLPAGLDEDLGLILRAARRRTLVLLVDDAHRVGPPVAQRMRALFSAAGEGVRLLVVCACRTAAPGAPPAPVHRFTTSIGSGRVSTLRLSPLDSVALATLIRDRVPGAPESLVGLLTQVGGGNPGLAITCLERMIHRGHVRERGGAWEVPAAVPEDCLSGHGDSLADLGGLEQETAHLIRDASVLGDSFLALTLCRLLQEDELKVEDHLHAAARYGLLESVGETEENGELTTRYRFTSPARRLALYRSLPGERRDALESRLGGLSGHRQPRR